MSPPSADLQGRGHDHQIAAVAALKRQIDVIAVVDTNIKESLLRLGGIRSLLCFVRGLSLRKEDLKPQLNRKSIQLLLCFESVFCFGDLNLYNQ